MQVEASVAILSVSLTAFPGIFATEESQDGLKNAKLRNFFIFQKLAFRKQHHLDEKNFENFRSHSAAVLGGSRNVVRGMSRTKRNNSDKFSDDWPLKKHEMQNEECSQKDSDISLQPFD